jgi:hypothetical protein
MNLPFVLFKMAFEIEFIITVGTLDLILTKCCFQYEAKDFFLFLVLRSYISCNS